MLCPICRKHGGSVLILTTCRHLLPGGDDDLDFDIDKNTGSIVVARRLDAGKRSNYNLTVRVTDGSQAITTQVTAGTLVSELYWKLSFTLWLHRSTSIAYTIFWFVGF